MRAAGSREREQDGCGEMLAADGRPNVIAGDRMKPGASQHAVKKLDRQHARSGPPGPTCAQPQRPMASTSVR